MEEEEEEEESVIFFYPRREIPRTSTEPLSAAFCTCEVQGRMKRNARI